MFNCLFALANMITLVLFSTWPVRYIYLLLFCDSPMRLDLRTPGALLFDEVIV